MWLLCPHLGRSYRYRMHARAHLWLLCPQALTAWLHFTWGAWYEVRIPVRYGYGTVHDFTLWSLGGRAYGGQLGQLNNVAYSSARHLLRQNNLLACVPERAAAWFGQEGL